MKKRFIIFFYFLSVCGLHRVAYAVVGSEDIDPEQLYRFQAEHDNMTQAEYEIKAGELIQKQGDVTEEKKKALREKKVVTAEGKQKDIKEQEKMAKQIAQLEVQLVPSTKKWFERIQVTPFAVNTYDTNLLHNKGSKGDFYFDTGSGATAALGTAKTQADVKYKGEYLTYMRYGKYDRMQNDLKVELGYKKNNKTKFTGFYRLNYGAAQTSEIRNFKKRLQQATGLGLNYRLSKKTGIRVDAEYYRQDFIKRTDRKESSQQMRIGPELDYFLSDKTSFFTRYYIGFSTGGPNRTNDNIANDFRGGIRGKIAPKTSALVDLGASIQKNTGSLSGINTAFVGHAIIIYDMTQKTRLEGFMHRSFNQAVETQGSSFYVTTYFGLRAVSKFTRRLVGRLEGGFRYNTFSQGGTLSKSGQRDTIITAMARLEYELRKWLSIGCQYGLNLDDSNISVNEYVSNQYTMDLKGRF